MFAFSTTLKKTMQDIKTQKNKCKGVQEKKEWVKVQANQSRSHTAVTFYYGCTCPRATCPSASQHSQMQQLTEEERG